MPYQSIKLKISPTQQAKALKGQKIRLTPDCIGTGQLVMVHPVNYKKIINAKGGLNLELSPGEIMASAHHHGLAGSGFFDSIWSGLKTAGKWLKDSGVGSALADVGQQLATPFVGPEIASAGRSLLKSTTGVGLGPALKAAKYRITNAKGKETHHVNVMPKGMATSESVPKGTHMTHQQKVDQWKDNVWAASPYPKRGKNKVAIGSGLYL